MDSESWGAVGEMGSLGYCTDGHETSDSPSHVYIVLEVPVVEIC